MFTNSNLKITNTPQPQLTVLDEKKKMASTVLKRVDQLIKSKELQKALIETAQVKEIDPTNVYAFALEERIKVLLAEDVKTQQKPIQNLFSTSPDTKNQDNKKEAISFQPKPDVTKNANSEVSAVESLPNKQLKPIENLSLPTTPVVTEVKNNLSQIRRKPKVVIIDDDVSLLSVLSMTIESGGFEVISLSTSDEAYILLKKFIPDIILCDINLETSTMGGFSFFEKVQQIEHLKHVPFVFLTGLNDDVLIRTGKEMGADDYLTKPIREQDLLAVIRGKTKRFGEIRKMITVNFNIPNTSLMFSKVQ